MNEEDKILLPYIVVGALVWFISVVSMLIRTVEMFQNSGVFIK